MAGLSVQQVVRNLLRIQPWSKLGRNLLDFVDLGMLVFEGTFLALD